MAEGELRRSTMEDGRCGFLWFLCIGSRQRREWSYFLFACFLLTVHVSWSSLRSFGIVGGIPFRCCMCILHFLTVIYWFTSCVAIFFYIFLYSWEICAANDRWVPRDGLIKNRRNIGIKGYWYLWYIKRDLSGTRKI